MTIETLAAATLAGLLLAAPPPPLAPFSPVARELAAGEAHTYKVELPAGRPFRVAVEQRGIDVTVEVAGPDGQRLVAVDSPQDRQGTESLLLVPGAAGAFAITVRAREPGAPPSGRYAIRLDEIAGEASRAAEEALSRAGELYLEGSAESYRQALPYYGAARERFRAAGDRQGEARALYGQAVVSRLVDETRAALALAREVLPLWQALGDPLFAAATENEIGLDRWLLREGGQGDEARAAFGRALALSRGAADRYGEAVAQSNLCLMDLSRGDLRPGVACYGRALPLLAEVRAEALLAGALTSLGRAYDALGEPQAARDRYEQALTRLRSLGNRDGEARTLNSLGVLDVGLGEVEAALARYGEALALFRALGDRRGQARVQNNLGLVYHTVDEPQRAKASYEAALALWRAVGDRAGEAATLTNLGLVQARLGQPREALAFHRQALEIERASGDRRGLGIALTQLGRTELALGRPAAALPLFDQAAERLAAAGDRRNQAEALCGQGEARAALGDGPGALANLTQALAMARNAGDRPAEVHALLALAGAERRLGQKGEARTHAAAALDAVESLRIRIGGPDLRAAFSSLVHRAYELDVDLLMEAHRAMPAAGFDRQALAVGERARARTLLDFLGDAGIGIREGVDPALLARRTGLAARLSAKAERAARERPAATPAISEEKREEEREQQEILRELDLVEAEIRAKSPGYADLTRPQPLDTPGIQALLDADTLLLAYSLGEERSYLWAVTPEAVASFELPPRAAIEALARQLHRQWSTAGPADPADPAKHRAAAGPAEALSRILLGPLAGRLDRQRLAVVADGALHYIPFAALPLPISGPAGEPLLARHEVVVLPSASALAVARRVFRARPPAPKWLAVLADPVFDRSDPRVPKPPALPAGAAPADPLPPPADLPPFARLPASRQEAEAIAALAPPGEALVALDFAADRQAVLGDRLAAYRVVHFATHGILDTDRPALSGLALSSIDRDGRPQAGFLPLRDVYNLRLTADLVVLSGCRTALGRELSGEGLVGLTRGFQYAGAARVVASLWPVEDRATERLMTRFYRGLWSEKLPPAAALRAAQLALRAERPYRDPFFWAGFVLAGDWR